MLNRSISVTQPETVNYWVNVLSCVIPETRARWSVLLKEASAVWPEARSRGDMGWGARCRPDPAGVCT